jgi:hypothetical protein
MPKRLCHITPDVESATILALGSTGPSVYSKFTCSKRAWPEEERNPMGTKGPVNPLEEVNEAVHCEGHLRDAFLPTLEDYLVGKAWSLDGFWYDETTQQLWDGMSAHERLPPCPGSGDGRRAPNESLIREPNFSA